MRLRAFALASWAVLGLGVTRVAADPITLTVAAGPMLQQTSNRLIGDPSCHNPASLPFTILPPHDPADVVSSPVYTVDQIRSLVGGHLFSSVQSDSEQRREEADSSRRPSSRATELLP